MFLQAETLDKQVEKPLRSHLETYRTVVNVRLNAQRIEFALTAIL